MPKPSITIAILSYNYGKYIRSAIESSLGQIPGEYILKEILVIDDGSDDNTRDILAEYPEVKSIFREHKGFAATLSYAVEKARGEWVSLLDADDVFLPQKLKTVADILSIRGLLFVQHGEYVVDALNRPFGEGRHPGGSTSTLLVNTAAAVQLLPVTNEMFFHVLNDFGHGLRLAAPLTNYRVHDESMTDRRTPGVFADYIAEVCGSIAERLNFMSQQPPTWASTDGLLQLSKLYTVKELAYRKRARLERRRNESLLNNTKEHR